MANTYDKSGSKVESTGTLEGAKGGSGSGGTGPTGSVRAYPKSKGNVSPHKTDFSPMCCPPSTYGVNGV
jgi:hypothetical protein